MYLGEEKMTYMEGLCITDAELMLFDDVKISADHSDLSHNPSKRVSLDTQFSNY